MKRLGLLLLHIWFGFNFFLASFIVLRMIFFQVNAPALTVYFEQSFIQTVSTEMVRLVNTMAILLNSVVAAYCGLALVILQKKAFFKEKWLFWSVMISVLFVQLAGFISDSYMGHRNLGLNTISTIILIVGIVLCLRVQSKEK